jgi:hypothetical protein
MGNKMGIFNGLGNHNPAGHDYNGFIIITGTMRERYISPEHLTHP